MGPFNLATHFLRFRENFLSNFLDSFPYSVSYWNSYCLKVTAPGLVLLHSKFSSLPTLCCNPPIVFWLVYFDLFYFYNFLNFQELFFPPWPSMLIFKEKLYSGFMVKISFLTSFCIFPFLFSSPCKDYFSVHCCFLLFILAHIFHMRDSL